MILFQNSTYLQNNDCKFTFTNQNYLLILANYPSFDISDLQMRKKNRSR